MRFLLDNNLSPRLVNLLAEDGHDAEHVRDRGTHSASDEDVLALARNEQRTLISADTDFGTLLARTGDGGPSVILVRRSSARRAEQLAALLKANLGQITDDPLRRCCRRCNWPRPTSPAPADPTWQSLTPLDHRAVAP